MLKIRGNYAYFKIAGFEYTPRSTMWHPRDDIAEAGTGEDAMHLGREVGDSGERSERNEGVFVNGLGEVSVVEKGSWSQFTFLRAFREEPFRARRRRIDNGVWTKREGCLGHSLGLGRLFRKG